MDQTQLQQQIARYFGKLPASSQKFFSDMNWMETLKSIGTKYNLNPNQIESLGTETTLALLGIVHLEQFKDALKTELAVSEDIFNKIFEEINTSVLIKSIVPELEQAFETNMKDMVEEKYGGVEKLDERFKSLPKEVQLAISESNYQTKLYDVAEEKELSIEQMQSLEEVTNKVLLNIIHPDKFQEEIKLKLGLDDTTTSEIVDYVNENVLRNIRNILRTHWEKNNGVGEGADDEVPRPPYAISISKEPIITPVQKIATEKNITANQTRAEDALYKNAGIEMVSDEKSTDDIAHSIIASKLRMPTASKPIVSNQTLPKVTPTAPIAPATPQVNTPTKTKDPYHEEI